MSLIACGIVGIFPAAIHRFEAQTGAVHMQILRAFGGRHLRKFMGELHQRSSQRDGPSLGGKLGPLFAPVEQQQDRHDSAIF
jgi:hypothetical protein